MQKKKIVQINAYYGTGSTGNIVRNIEKSGNDCGFDMYSVYWLKPNEKDSENVFFVGNRENRSIVKKYAEWICLGGRLSYNVELTKKIVETVKKINPDVIHLHNLHGDFEYGTLDFCILFEYLINSKKSIIWTLHDCWPITGRCYYFEYKKCDKWKNGCGSCPQRLFDREGIFFDYSAQNWINKKKYYDAIDDMTVITVSNWLNSVVKQSMLKNKRVITIYNGLNTDIFSQREKAHSGSLYKILCIGWDRRKGYKDYFKLSKYLSPDEEIVVVGKRPFFRRYKRLPSNIREIERANSAEQMAEIYRSADVYFNASPAETFGLTTAEAMSCGLPVIGYDNTATAEIIKLVEGDFALAKDRDVKGVYDAIQAIKENSINKNLFYKKRLHYFREDRMIQNYLKLYKEHSCNS